MQIILVFFFLIIIFFVVTKKNQSIENLLIFTLLAILIMIVFLATLNNPFTLLFLGFSNSLFLILPFSIGHLLTIRRFLLYGPRPALVSICATLIGQFTFITSVLLGFRGAVMPWLGIWWLHFFLGLHIYRRFCKEEIPTQQLYNPKFHTQPKVLGGYFFDNLVLAWTEQITLFQYFQRLTFSRQPISMESFFSPDRFLYLFQNIGYITGLALGSIFFTVVFGYLLNRFKEFLFSVGTFGRVFKTINLFSVTIISASFLASLPFTHSAPDFFVTNPLGSTYGDRSLRSPHTLTHLENSVPVNMDTYFRHQAAENENWTLKSFCYDDSFSDRMFIQSLKKKNQPKPLKKDFFGSKKQKCLIKEINSISFQQCWKKPVFSQDWCLEPKRFQVLMAEKKKLGISIDMKCKFYVGEPYQLSSHKKVRRWLESF